MEPIQRADFKLLVSSVGITIGRMIQKFLSAAPLLIAIVLIGHSVVRGRAESEPRRLQTVEVRGDWQAAGYPAKIVPGSIYDGDTIRVKSTHPELAKYADGKGEIKVRFACIDAPEKQQQHGIMARDTLRSILAAGEVSVDPVDVDRYGRVVAELWNEDGLVQSAMVVAGAAFPYEEYKENCKSWDAVSYSGQLAKEEKVGVWADASPEYPWEWRRR